MIYEGNVIPGIVVGCIFGYIVFAINCGIIAHYLGYNRGFTRTQFWWGFGLGILGICMVGLMPTYRIYDDDVRESKKTGHNDSAFNNVLKNNFDNGEDNKK